jgi:hypothetical protein
MVQDKVVGLKNIKKIKNLKPQKYKNSPQCCRANISQVPRADEEYFEGPVFAAWSFFTY